MLTMTVEMTPAMSHEEFDALFGELLKAIEPWKLNSLADHMIRFARDYRKGGSKPRNRKERKPKPSKEHRREDYEKYMKSALWAAIRKEVLDRDGHRCLSCGDPATEVHHRSYSIDVLEGRDNAKLASLCGRCHNRIHYGSDNVKLTKSKTEKLLRSMIMRRSTRSGIMNHNALMTQTDMR
jgi:5-methylcytosine-specific restriction endonuclease McrA